MLKVYLFLIFCFSNRPEMVVLLAIPTDCKKKTVWPNKTWRCEVFHQCTNYINKPDKGTKFKIVCPSKSKSMYRAWSRKIYRHDCFIQNVMYCFLKGNTIRFPIIKLILHNVVFCIHYWQKQKLSCFNWKIPLPFNSSSSSEDWTGDSGLLMVL